jgi:succinate dehydrogenase hydrophobic anchor subunit
MEGTEMSDGGWLMLLVTVIVVGTLLFLIYATARSIQTQRTQGRSIWREFALGLILMILFLMSWVGQAVAEWQVFTDEQRSHGETPELGDFASEFAQSTLENWQSEFLQLFSFVTLAALFIHKGSAESKDSDEKLEASLRRIEEHLGTLPPDAPQAPDERWQLPHTPLDVADRTG